MLRGWRRYIGALGVVAMAMMVAVAVALGLSPAYSQGEPQAQSQARATQGPAPETRLALVIGNADYPSGPLPTAANDAGLVARSLAQAGFAVTAAGNVDRAALRKMFDAFLAKTKAAGPDVVVFVYLSGYGLQYDGDAYVVPVDAAPQRESEVPLVAVRLADFVHALEAMPAKSRIVVEDLARENPFVKLGEPLAGGLALIEAPTGSLYATNAAPGTVAAPDVAPYGFYARALSEMIEEPELTPSHLFERVRLRVSTLTNGAEIPWDDDKLGADEAFIPAVTQGTGTSPAAALVDGPPASAAFWTSIDRDNLLGYQAFAKAYPRDNLALRVRAMIAARREALIWSGSRRANDPRAYWTYMRRYPRGPHLFDARRRLAALRAALEPPPRFDIYVYPDVAPPTPTEAAIVGRPFVVFEDPEWEPVPAPPRALLPPPRDAFYEALPPPPLVPAGFLPIPVPVAGDGEGPGKSGAVGRILQPGRPGHGEISIENSVGPGQASVMTVATSDGKVISRTVTSGWHGNARTIVQTGANDALISRTTSLRDHGELTTIQSGPGGAVLSKAISRIEADGTRSTTITNGGDQIVARLQSNRDGVVITAKRGPVPVLEQTYVLTPPATVQTLARQPTRGDASPIPASPRFVEPTIETSVRPSLPVLPAMAPTGPTTAPPITGTKPANPYGRLAPAPTWASPAAPPSPAALQRPLPAPALTAVKAPVLPTPRPRVIRLEPVAPTKEPARQTSPSRRETQAHATPPRKEPPAQAKPRRVEPQRAVIAPHPAIPPRRPDVRPPPKAKVAAARPVPEPRRARPTRGPSAVSKIVASRAPASKTGASKGAVNNITAAKSPASSKGKLPGRRR